MEENMFKIKMLELLNSNNKLAVKLKPNSVSNSILGFDAKASVFLISIVSPPIDGRANQELVRFLSKFLKVNLCIKSGLRSKLKILEVK